MSRDSLVENDRHLGGRITEMVKAVDRFEDRVDGRAYDDLLPLHIKFAFEDILFGWSHLSSSVLGHVVITIGAYLLLQLTLSILPFDVVRSASTWNLIKLVVSLVGSIAAFRMVRRRRYVWLPTAYGSHDYRHDEQRRRKAVAETDYSTLLGHLSRRSQAYVYGRLERELVQAEEVFQSRKEKQTPTSEILPANQVQSIENDQVVFTAGPIKNMPYSHGCFFGAAPFMLANPDWISILRRLMPDVYVEISRRVLHAPARRLIHWAENNPVVAAYGTANVLENTGNLVNLEWDVFLDPRLVRAVELVLEQRGRFMAMHCGKGITLSPKEKKRLDYFDAELANRSTHLVDKMLIAHGNLTQLLLEQTGLFKDYNYSRVKRNRQTLGGGMYARQWMAVYAEALRLGVNMSACNVNQTSATVEESLQGSSSSSCCTAASTESEDEDEPSFSKSKKKSFPNPSYTSCPWTSIEESVELMRRVTKKTNPIGLVLDIKSRYVSKHIWSIVVDKLNAAGARVEAIASFAVEEIRDISSYCTQQIKEVIFCHSAGDLQRACHDGRVQYGDTVVFNGGSLLWESPKATFGSLPALISRGFDAAAAMERYAPLPFASTTGGGSTLKAYKEKLNLKLGIYVQEFGIDEAAVNTLTKLVNDNDDTFEIGFSWGGINGVTVGGIRPGRWTSTDGYHTQRYAGLSWDPTLSVENVTVKLHP